MAKPLKLEPERGWEKWKCVRHWYFDTVVSSDELSDASIAIIRDRRNKKWYLHPRGGGCWDDNDNEHDLGPFDLRTAKKTAMVMALTKAVPDGWTQE